MTTDAILRSHLFICLHRAVCKHLSGSNHGNVALPDPVDTNQQATEANETTLTLMGELLDDQSLPDLRERLLADGKEELLRLPERTAVLLRGKTTMVPTVSKATGITTTVAIDEPRRFNEAGMSDIHELLRVQKRSTFLNL